MSVVPTLPFDLSAFGGRIAGVDEAGRGPLAGPVVAAAVILDPGSVPPGVGDSKTIAAPLRVALAGAIRDAAVAWGLGRAEPAEIDELDILRATMLAMQRAVAALATAPQHVLVDGNRCPRLAVSATAVVRGDALVPAIGAASILAKVARDAEMVAMDDTFPGYGFARHKGYPTRAHRDALERLGPCKIHRRTFGPVRAVMERGSTSGNSR